MFPNSFELLARRFNKIYVLTMSTRNDRRPGIFNMLVSIGYNPDKIEHKDKVTFIYATPWPYNELIVYYINTAYSRQCFSKPNEYDCVRNHYSIIKQSFDLGYENILILEDDIRFLKPSLLNPLLENIPEDFDIIRFNGFSTMDSAKNFMNLYNQGTLYVKNPNTKLWNAGCYGLSRKGMKYYIEYIDKNLWVADGPLYDVPDYINYYISTIPGAIQVDKEVIASDIRNNQNDSINYNKDNTYECLIDKTYYIDYKICDETFA